jgi:3-deoxy-D-manno-octulosonic-acid transferase
MIWIYRLVFLPALILASPMYLRRMFRRGGYGDGFGQRFGRVKDLPPKRDGVRRIWLQAVSVGEILAVGPLLRSLAARGDNEVYLTTTTSTGYALACEKYSGLTLAVGYFPIDFWSFSARAWRKIAPDLVLLAEAEAWPEHVRHAGKRGVPVLLLNARLSDRSFRRYSRFPTLARSLFEKLTVILPSSAEDTRRFIALGVDAAKLHQAGNLKFDVSIPPLDDVTRAVLRAELGFPAGAKILLGSSTWPGEEEALLDVLEAARAIGTDWRLLIVPRHAERRGEIEKLFAGRQARWHLRSLGAVPPEGVDVLVADTTGELAKLTQLADLVFIGKSIPPNNGGQTPIEASSLGKPLLFGPNMTNFRNASASLVAIGAAEVVADAPALRAAALRLMRDEVTRSRMATVAANWHIENQGATARTMEKIAEFLKV